MNYVSPPKPLVGLPSDSIAVEPRARRSFARRGLFVAASVFSLAVPMKQAMAAPGDTHTQAVQKGVDFLTPDVVNFTAQNQCIACHRQGAALYGLALSKGAGFAVDMTPMGAPYVATAIANDEQPSGYWDWGGPNNLKSSYNFYGLAGYDAYMATAYSDKLVLAADFALTRQQADGRWYQDFDDGETAHGDVTVTARYMVGIAQAMQRVDANKAATYKAALDNAVGFLTAAQSDNSDYSGVGFDYEVAWAIIGLKAAGLADSDPTVQSYVTMLQARQSGIGYAWGLEAGWGPDVFNSGMAIYALCKAGVPAIGNTALQQSLTWVNDQQQSDGTWGSDAYTTFAILGLSCYGDYGVIVNNQGVVTRVISSHKPTPQTVTYDFDVQNHGFIDDTYNLTVAGGMPGWTSSIPGTVSITAGAHATVTLTVNAPPNLPEALPVQMAVVATSQAVSTLSSSARITTFTDPPPPTSGDSTQVVLTSGNGDSVTLGQTGSLSATVTDTTANTQVHGAGKGVVTFFVAGLAIATDTDADGDGVFTVPFSPDCGWTALGTQDFRAIYSGIDLPDGQTDMLSSLASGTISLIAPACCPKPEICNGQDDDCDGVADNGNPGGGATCSTGLAGACSDGALACTLNGIVCVPGIQPGQLTETCNGEDDDCDGVVDNGFHIGEACTSGQGICAATGVYTCTVSHESACTAVPSAPQTEICGDKLDSNCDGNPNDGCACLSDSDCGDSASGQACDTGGGGTFTCIMGCRAQGGNSCPDALLCTSQDSSVGQCVVCLDDSDCGDTKSGKICATGSHTCEVGCRGSDGNGCSGSSKCTSTDASVGKCVGCLADADCGTVDSGMVCDAATATCQSGCRASGNGCPADMVCSSVTDEIGACALSSDTGAGGGSSTSSGGGRKPVYRGPGATTGGDTVIIGSQSAAGGSAPSSDAPPDGNGTLSGGSNGCSCSTQPGHDSDGAAWFVIGTIGFMVSRRRQNRAA